MDFQALLLGDLALKDSSPSIHHNGPHQFPDNADHRVRRESDTESGFEDGNSCQLSKSLVEEAGRLSESDSLENLQIEQVLMELMSVATEWKSLRNVKNCSCAMPFEQYTKKVGLNLVCMWSKHHKLIPIGIF